MKRAFISFGFLVIFMVCSVFSQSLWNTEKESMFSSTKAHKIGDIVIIQINESSSANQSASTTTKTSNKISLNNNKGTGELQFMPLFGLTGDHSNDFSGDGTTSRKGKVTAKVAAKITEDLGNGNYLIRGTKILNVNGEKEIISLSGIIRESDISNLNMIESTKIYNIQLDYTGKGNIDSSRKPGILSKAINWLF